MKAIEYWIHVVMYEFIVMACVMLPLLVLGGIVGWGDGTALGNVVNFVCVVYFVGGLILAHGVANAAAFRRCTEEVGFFEALGDSIAKFIPFFPKIGRVRRAKHPPFDGPPDPIE